jgi:hypothetical protein
MGGACDYTCRGCGYHVDFMVNGYDVGMGSHVHAVLCRDCRELRVSRLEGHPATMPIEPRQLAEAISRLTLSCPENPAHRVERWEHPGPCPRCGVTLQRGRNLILWD